MSRVYLFRVEQIFPYPRFKDFWINVYACKIGLVESDDPPAMKKRISTCQSNCPWKVSLDGCSGSMSLKHAEASEDYYRDRFWREHIHGDWFAIRPERLNKLKNEIMIAHTLTERLTYTLNFLEA